MAIEDRDDYENDEDGSPPRAMIEGGPRRRPVLTAERRRELLAFAMELADLVERRTKSHERCLLRSMVEMMVETR